MDGSRSLARSAEPNSPASRRTTLVQRMPFTLLLRSALFQATTQTPSLGHFPPHPLRAPPPFRIDSTFPSLTDLELTPFAMWTPTDKVLVQSRRSTALPSSRRSYLAGVLVLAREARDGGIYCGVRCARKRDGGVGMSELRGRELGLEGGELERWWLWGSSSR